MSAEVWRRGLAGGFRPALLVAIGSLVGDAVWAVLALSGLAFVVETDEAQLALSIAGGIVLLALALKAFLAARVATVTLTTPASRGRSHFATGAAISLANPYAIAFWAGAGGGVTVALADGGRAALAVFVAGFMLAALLWSFLIAALIGRAHRRAGPQFARWANLAAAVVLAYFGVRLLWSAT